MKEEIVITRTVTEEFRMVVRKCEPSSYPPERVLDTEGVELPEPASRPSNVIPLRRAG
jgi:hypothetical protein